MTLDDLRLCATTACTLSRAIFVADEHSAWRLREMALILREDTVARIAAR